MKTVATVTSKGQITIPRIVRQSLGLRQGDRLEFDIEQGKVELRAARSALTSAGILKGHLPKAWKSKTTEEMDEAIGREVGRKHRGT